MRASFAGTVTDNSQFSFTVSSVTADIAGSTFATADAGAAASSITDDRNKIEVLTTAIIINQNVSNVTVGVVMSPSPSVTALDNLANFDLDNTSNVTMTITTGTTTFNGTATTTVAMVAGTATFSNLVFSTTTNSNKLTATQGLLSDISSFFNVSLVIAFGDVIISEVMYDNNGTDNEWIELYNTTENTIDLSNWYITDAPSYPATAEGDCVIPNGTTISANSYLVIAINGSGVNADNLVDITNEIQSKAGPRGAANRPTLNNSGDNIALYTAASSGTLIDGSLSVAFPGLSGFSSGESIERIGNAEWETSSSWVRAVTTFTGTTYTKCTPGNVNLPSLAGSISISNITIPSGQIITLGSNTLTLSGTIAGSGKLKGIATSNLVITGASGTIAFDQTTPGTTNVLKNLTISGSGNTTLGNALNITAGSSSGTVTVGAGATLATGGNLTLKSDALGTASVGNSAGTITGNVTVERFIPNKRAWRALTAPLKGSVSDASIFSQWQNNGATVDNTGVELWGPAGDTTPSSNNSGLKVGPNSSILQYVSGAWSGVTNTNDTKLFTTDRNNAFMVFPTGPYNSGLISSSLPAEPTTLKATGQLITGEVTYSNIPTTSHTLIGNPYASPINLNSILDASTTLEKYFWVWDPRGANQGAYNMFDADLDSYTFQALSYNDNTVIQSGQAFFVKAASSTNSFTINENNKSTASTNYVFRNNNPAQLLRVGLYKQENNEWSGRDGAMTAILSDAATNQTPNKMANGSENVAFVKNGLLFASNHHLPLVASDVLNIRVWRTTTGANYKLKINTEDFVTTNLSATLEDLFTNSRTPLNLEGAAVEYPFTVTTDALSTGDRFRIVFQNAVLGTNNPTATGFSIVPNPVTGDSFQVNLGTLATGIYTYSIYNAIGQEVEKGSFQNTTQNTNYEVKMSNSATGIYIMKIKGKDNTVFTAKIIKK